MVHLVFIVIGLGTMSSSSIHDNHTRTFLGVPLWFFFFFLAFSRRDILAWSTTSWFLSFKIIDFSLCAQGHMHTLRSQAWCWIFSIQQLLSFFLCTCLTLACPVGPKFLLTKLSSWPLRAELIYFFQICSVRSHPLPLFPKLYGIPVIPLPSAMGNWNLCVNLQTKDILIYRSFCSGFRFYMQLL